jgi:hypothetical protein
MSKIDEDELVLGLRKDLDKILEEFNCLSDNISKDIEDEKCGRVRRIIKHAFLATIQTYRLYFIIRSGFSSLLSSIPFL